MERSRPGRRCEEGVVTWDEVDTEAVVGSEAEVVIEEEEVIEAGEERRCG